MHLLPRLLLLLLVCLPALATAQAGTLTGVRTFTAPGHARLLLVLDGAAPNAELTTRASAPIGAIAARGITWVGDVQPGPDLPVEVPIAENGVRRVLVAPVGGGVQVTVELDDARSVRAQRIHAKAVLVDLYTEGQAEAGGLPTEAQLIAFVQGVDLRRAAGAAPTTRTRIVLDAGHGGWDHGAVGVTGTREADIALQLVRRTRQQLEEQLGAEVILTRDSDVFLTLTERARIANTNEADLFISIHANAAPGPAAWGIETYSMDTASDAGAARVAARENAIAWQEGEGEGADRIAAKLITTGTMRLSRELAAHVQSGVCQHLSRVYGRDNVRDLGNKTALFSVLTRTRMPAILFESSFVSNPTDERRLRAPHFQQNIADAIARGVGLWLERQGLQQASQPGRTAQGPR